MLQKSRFSRIQLYHFDPTNAASEPKDRENYAKTAFFPLDPAIQRFIVCNPRPKVM
jgi:hypothetical protein